MERKNESTEFPSSPLPLDHFPIVFPPSFIPFGAQNLFSFLPCVRRRNKTMTSYPVSLFSISRGVHRWLGFRAARHFVQWQRTLSFHCPFYSGSHGTMHFISCENSRVGHILAAQGCFDLGREVLNCGGKSTWKKDASRSSPKIFDGAWNRDPKYTVFYSY